MDLTRIVETLRAIGPRGACTDGERRAAVALAGAVRATGRTARIETSWVRPQWPAIWFVHAVLGLAGSVLSVSAPVAGLVLAGVAALSALAEAGGTSALGLLWPRRATQNVVAPGFGDAPVRLLVTAAYDAPRSRGGLGAPLLGVDRALRRLTRGRWPAPLVLLTLALVVIAACAGARVGEIEAGWLGAVQLVPTAIAIVACALLADLAFTGPDLDDRRASSAAAAALALVARLDERPPRRLEVDLVLCGAGDAQALGARRHVRDHPAAAEAIAVLALEPAGDAVAVRGGPVLSLAFHPDLVAAATEAGFAPVHARGWSAAAAARRAGWPAVAVGGDDAAPLDAEVVVARCVELVKRLDAKVAGRTT